METQGMFKEESSQLDINAFSITDLLTILGLTYPPNAKDIQEKTKAYIQANPNKKSFFQLSQAKLEDYFRNNMVDKNLQTQTDNWWENEALPQTDAPTQKDKITDRKQKIDVYSNAHVPMNRDQLGVNNVIDTKVAQDTLNPNLENITTRFIQLDSQFRQGGTVSTDYTMDLSDPLTDVLSLRLYSYQIPFTWYAIDEKYGNTCFWVINQGASFKITIEPGNYSPSDFVKTLNQAFTNAGFYVVEGNQPLTFTCVYYNKNNAKLTLQLGQYNANAENAIFGISPILMTIYDPNGNPIQAIEDPAEFNIETDAYFQFYDTTSQLSCQTTGCHPTQVFTQTLGWLMGYRSPIQPILLTGNPANSILNLAGPKYFILILDDFNQNHINNGLITITELSTKLDLPDYYIPTLPIQCSIQTQLEIQQQNQRLGQLPPDNELIEEEKLILINQARQKIYPTAPRTLTQSQIYTINQTLQAREKTTTFRGKAPNPSDTFALLPIKGLTPSDTGELYVDFSGSLQDNKRIYFGPVDIDRLHLKLLDDRGFIVDLHGAEWCVTLISENLYQY
jgi:hypothetical protein